jgi:hypothetical protein
MMHHLKERGKPNVLKREIRGLKNLALYHISAGMSSFVREYVITQNIPIVKLLFAFGISLVIP